MHSFLWSACTVNLICPNILKVPFTEGCREAAAQWHTSCWKCISTRGCPRLCGFVPQARTQGFRCLGCQEPHQGSKNSRLIKMISVWSLKGLCGIKPSVCEILAQLFREMWVGEAVGDVRRHGAIPGRAGHKEGVTEYNSPLCLNFSNLIFF